MLHAVVTGATGFTGGHLSRRLVDRGQRVTAIVRPTSDTAALERLGVRCVAVKLDDAPALADVCEGVDKIYHVAAAYRTEHAERDEFDRVNVEGTRCLLAAARAAQVSRFVHCSTVGVQGEIDDPPADEEYRFAPGDHYQESKLQGELLACQAGEQGLDVAVVRPVGIYGPGDTRFLKLFRAIDRGRFVMIGSGDQLYHLTYIDDLVNGFLLAGEREEAIGEVFTIAGPRYTTLTELVELIAAVLQRRTPRLRVPFAPVYLAAAVCEAVCAPLGLNPPLYRRRMDFFSKDRAFSTDKARRLLGYEPQVDLEEGLRRTASWYREQELI